MINYIIKIAIILLCFTKAFGQDCSYIDLSHKLNFETHLQTFSHGQDYDSSTVTLSIFSKATKKKLQEIKITTQDYFSKVFTDCSAKLSYSTGKNLNKEISDNDYGDIIVADLNFDSLEDIAIKKESGGNAGPIYYFYVQDENGVFKINKFLTDSMGSFPKYINKRRKTLTTLLHASAFEQCKTIYKFMASNRTWKVERSWVKY